jgi:hypothetical protein
LLQRDTVADKLLKEISIIFEKDPKILQEIPPWIRESNNQEKQLAAIKYFHKCCDPKDTWCCCFPFKSNLFGGQVTSESHC